MANFPSSQILVTLMMEALLAPHEQAHGDEGASFKLLSSY
jgi:hypothetical protein